ncbi:restriction endonuclease subunit S [Mycoplasma sp. 31_09]|uniref:restriction endonuclease subunit S n=1 Tax=Mycoplasma sp. 31_09 TaxID=3401663 RepID=UPI003AB0B90D
MLRAQGVQRFVLNREHFNSLSVIKPSILEQKKINKFLFSLDSYINSQKLKLKKLNEVKQSLLNKMFALKNQKFPEIRFKGFAEEWKKFLLGEVSEYKNGKAHESYVESKGKYVLVNSKFISSNGIPEKYTNTNLSPLYLNDIAMVLSDVPRGKALAKVFFVDRDNKYALNQRICALTTKKTFPKFLSLIINRNNQLLDLDDGVNQTNITRKQVLNIKMLIPSYNEQKKIGAFFSSLDSLIRSQELKLEKLNNIKQALLEKMFC